jgi:hypothetical protein
MRSDPHTFDRQGVDKITRCHAEGTSKHTSGELGHQVRDLLHVAPLP